MHQDHDHDPRKPTLADRYCAFRVSGLCDIELESLLQDRGQRGPDDGLIVWNPVSPWPRNILFRIRARPAAPPPAGRQPGPELVCALAKPSGSAAAWSTGLFSLLRETINVVVSRRGRVSDSRGGLSLEPAVRLQPGTVVLSVLLPSRTRVGNSGYDTGNGLNHQMLREMLKELEITPLCSSRSG